MSESIAERISDHFLNPRNQGELTDADLVLEAGDIRQGDAVKLMIKFDASRRICAAHFQSFGAYETIAAFSILTELLIGKSLDEALSITENDILQYVHDPGAPFHREANRAVSILRSTKWRSEERNPAQNEIE
jgi:NifU-like protein involved in Fe-S cluster formation